MLILSPRAVERLETYVPGIGRCPRVFRMTKRRQAHPKASSKGETINTPSMLAVEDYVDLRA